jgi:signal peptidase I
MRAPRKRSFFTCLLALTLMGLAPAYLRAYKITGASSVPTVLVGDTIIVNQAAYRLNLPYSGVELFRTGSPRRGDFVFLYLPGRPRLRGFFKRIVGLPGETIELRENRVLIDGRPLPATALDAAGFAWVPKGHPIGTCVELEDGHWITFTPEKGRRRNFPPTRLAPGQYFLLGDNRDESLDSRDFGPVSGNLLTGKVVAILPTAARAK